VGVTAGKSFSPQRAQRAQKKSGEQEWKKRGRDAEEVFKEIGEVAKGRTVPQ
jgi:hypothetical protein